MHPPSIWCPKRNFNPLKNYFLYGDLMNKIDQMFEKHKDKIALNEKFMDSVNEYYPAFEARLINHSFAFYRFKWPVDGAIFAESYPKETQGGEGNCFI